jgi:hypothetical protein
MKTYTFIFADQNSNELTRKQFELNDDKEAYDLCKKLLAECMINDCTEVYFID